MNIIELKNIHKTYNEGKSNAVHALKGINLSVESGESVAIMGISGSGKSTLLHIIGCLDVATEGSYFLNGKDISSYNQKQLAAVRNGKIGFVLQDYGLLLNEKVVENIRLPLMFSDKYPLKKIGGRVREITELLGIRELEKKKVRELSGGQKQRVAIARAIINDPDIILADEPTGALDSGTAREIMGALTDVNARGKTLVIVTHDKAVAEMASRTVFIKDGVIDDVK